MYVCVYMYMYMINCAYVCVYIYIYICMYVRMTLNIIFINILAAAGVGGLFSEVGVAPDLPGSLHAAIYMI